MSTVSDWTSVTFSGLCINEWACYTPSKKNHLLNRTPLRHREGSQCRLHRQHVCAVISEHSRRSRYCVSSLFRPCILLLLLSWAPRAPVTSGWYVPTEHRLAYSEEVQLNDKISWRMQTILAKRYCIVRLLSLYALENVRARKWLNIRIQISLVLWCIMTQYWDYSTVVTFSLPIYDKLLWWDSLPQGRRERTKKNFIISWVPLSVNKYEGISFGLTQFFKIFCRYLRSIDFGLGIVLGNFVKRSVIISTPGFTVVVFACGPENINGQELRESASGKSRSFLLCVTWN